MITYLKFQMIEKKKIDNNPNKKRAFDLLCESLEKSGFIFESYKYDVLMYKGYDVDRDDEYLLGITYFIIKNKEIEDLILTSEALFYVNGILRNSINLVLNYVLNFTEPIPMNNM